jgi:light-regulated signal transduction histidine kinase (bacteriophytochrome)
VNPEDVAISNCESEPVHIPGRIQTFGSLIGFDTATAQITYVSENLPTMFAELKTNCLGTSFDDVSGNRDFIHAVRGALGLPTIADQRERVGQFKLGSQQADVSAVITGGTAIVELEPIQEIPVGKVTPVTRVRSLLSRIETTTDLSSLLDSAVKALRKLTGFDRVMAYKFLHSGAGEVVSEACSPGLEPFLGLRYPASDIPSQVRDLMVRVPFRICVDIHDPHVNVVGLTEEPLNMSHCHTRGISPIHVEYLKNMGVSSTMSTSIIVRGGLWGLFAFHNDRPFRLTPDQRSIVELLGHLVSMQVQQRIEKESLDARKQTDSILRSVQDTKLDTLPDLFEGFADEFTSTLEADGAVLIMKEQFFARGETPSEDFARRLLSVVNEDVVSIESFAAIDGLQAEEQMQSAGALLMELKQNSVYIAFFRNEIVEQVRWAGAKEKKIEYGPNGPRLHPRASFAEYQESVAGRCAPWQKLTLEVAMSIRAILRDRHELTKDETAHELRRQMAHRDLLIAELNHRVKNILALVRSITRQTRASTESLDHYAASLEKRIMALSSAHDLIGGSGLQWARLEELIRKELLPFTSSGKYDVEISGPPIGLTASVSPMMALVLHELVTNAAKHGALSDRGRKLTVKWKRESGGLCLLWSEEIEGTLSSPDSHGFGLSLIRRAVPYECNGDCTMEFAEDGLKVRFWMPNDAVETLPSVVAETPDVSESSVEIQRNSAVVVEDNMVIAMEMESLLVEIGFEKVRAFSGVKECLSHPSSLESDIAILDIDLGGETSFALAEKFIAADVPIIFVSGYDSKSDLPENLKHAQRLRKPVDQAGLKAAIRKVTEK